MGSSTSTISLYKRLYNLSAVMPVGGNGVDVRSLVVNGLETARETASKEIFSMEKNLISKQEKVGANANLVFPLSHSKKVLYFRVADCFTCFRRICYQD